MAREVGACILNVRALYCARPEQAGLLRIAAPPSFGGSDSELLVVAVAVDAARVGPAAGRTVGAEGEAAHREWPSKTLEAKFGMLKAKLGTFECIGVMHEQGPTLG